MKPILTSPQRLILRSRPWALGIGLVCALLIFAAIGLNKLMAGEAEEAAKLLILFALFAVVAAAFVRQEVVIFDRASGLVVIRSASVFGAREQSHRLDACKSAEVEKASNDSTDSRVKTYRPVLVCQDGTKVPLSTTFTSGSAPADAAKAVNVWLNQRKG